MHRLPTADEWEAALRGPDGNLFPWGSDWSRQKDVPLRRDVTVGPDPVRAVTDDITPLGVKHLVGNVCEFTSSKEKYREQDGKIVELDIICGASYCGQADAVLKQQKAYPSFSMFTTGFRYVIPVRDGRPQKAE